MNAGPTLRARFPQAIAACQDLTVQRKVLVNAAPVAVISGPIMVAAGDAVVFHGAQSGDPDGALTAFLWDFGDGGTASGVSAVSAGPPAPGHPRPPQEPPRPSVL